MRYRSRTDIIVDILRVAVEGGATKTSLMHTAVVPYSRLKQYLAVLVDNAYLEWDRASDTFRTTEKGRRFLRNIEEFGDIMMKSMTEAS
jgi:predicted transcriptional regulator